VAPQPDDPTAETRATELKLILAEYDKVKSEQHGRIQARDGLVYTTLATMAAVIAGTIQQHNAAVLLLLPPVSLVLAWKYLANDEKISVAGEYVRDRMTPRLTELTGISSVFGWESAHRGGVHRSVRRHVQRLVDLMTFWALPMAALVGFWTIGAHPAGLLVVVSVVEAAMELGVAWLVIAATRAAKAHVAGHCHESQQKNQPALARDPAA
jgi:hypothetical protein